MSSVPLSGRCSLWGGDIGEGMGTCACARVCVSCVSWRLLKAPDGHFDCVCEDVTASAPRPAASVHRLLLHGRQQGNMAGFCDCRAFQLAAVVHVCVSLAVSVCGWAACVAAGHDQPIPYSISLDADSPFFAASCPDALKTGSLAVAAADSVPGGEILCPAHAHASCCTQQEPQVCTLVGHHSGLPAAGCASAAAASICRAPAPSHARDRR